MTTSVTAADLANDAREFLRFKRAMGIKYQRAEFVLDGFLRFVAQHWGNHREVMLDDAVRRWCARIAGRKAVTVGNEFGVVRQLCLFRRRRDLSSYVPEHALARSRNPFSCLISSATTKCTGLWLRPVPTTGASSGPPCCAR
jgi:integrase/recombinase XerD